MTVTENEKYTDLVAEFKVSIEEWNTRNDALLAKPLDTISQKALDIISRAWDSGYFSGYTSGYKLGHRDGRPIDV